MLDCLHAWVMLGDDAACLSGLSVGLPLPPLLLCFILVFLPNNHQPASMEPWLPSDLTLEQDLVST